MKPDTKSDPAPSRAIFHLHAMLCGVACLGLLVGTPACSNTKNLFEGLDLVVSWHLSGSVSCASGCARFAYVVIRGTTSLGENVNLRRREDCDRNKILIRNDDFKGNGTFTVSVEIADYSDRVIASSPSRAVQTTTGDIEPAELDFIIALDPRSSCGDAGVGGDAGSFALVDGGFEADRCEGVAMLEEDLCYFILSHRGVKKYMPNGGVPSVSNPPEYKRLQFYYALAIRRSNNQYAQVSIAAGRVSTMQPTKPRLRDALDYWRAQWGGVEPNCITPETDPCSIPLGSPLYCGMPQVDTTLPQTFPFGAKNNAQPPFNNPQLWDNGGIGVYPRGNLGITIAQGVCPP